MKKTVLSTMLILAVYVAAHGQHNTYYIGHSGFGWDLMIGEMVNDLATDAGITTYGYNFQFIGGTCIANQWLNHASPQGGTDSWVELPTGNYNIVVLAEQIPILEVIYGCWPSMITSVQIVDSFYDMSMAANPNTRMYLMEFHNEIDQTAPTPYSNWINMNDSMRPLWEQVADSVSLLNTGPNVCIVPVAAAFQALADSVIAGVYPGLTDWIEIFSPYDTVVSTVHPTEETYYLVACVHYATIFGQSPVGLTNQTYATDGWPFAPPTSAQALMMQEIAWEIVSNDPYACMPTTTGIHGNPLTNTEIQVTSYPNPFENTVTIKAIDYQFTHAVFKLYNALGEQIRHIEKINGTEFIVDKKDLTSGIYYYKLTDKNGLSVNSKLIVE